MRDIRNERTEKAIADAFLEELASKPFADITVSSVAQKADVSRSTFYAHFSNTRDVFDRVLAEFVGNVRYLNAQLRCAACGDGKPGRRGQAPLLHSPKVCRPLRGACPQPRVPSSLS